MERAFPGTQGCARTITLPAPSKGWYAEQALTSLQEDVAIKMINWFPEIDGVTLRRGYIRHTQHMGAEVTTLYSYQIGHKSKLLAMTQTGIYDVTASGPATLLQGNQQSGKWSCITFAGYGLMVNGKDTPKSYDGERLVDLNYKGIDDPSKISQIYGYRNRVFCWCENARSFYYGEYGAIQGPLEEFKLAGVASLSGKILAMGTLAVDGGQGPKDVLAIFFSSGQVVLYSGDDPGSMEDWEMVGIFKIAPPISPRGILKYGRDLIVITEEGYVSLLKSLALEGGYTQVSDHIASAVKHQVRKQKNTFGWQGLYYPKGGMMIFNVPFGADTKNVPQFAQHIMNIQTGAWCCFRNMNGTCWELHDGELYFAGTEGVFKADTGSEDLGQPIEGEIQTSFSPLGPRNKIKQWVMAKPMMLVDKHANFKTNLSVDYVIQDPEDVLSDIESGGNEWDAEESYWGESDWSNGADIKKTWENITGLGLVASFSMRVKSRSAQVRLYAVEFLYRLGGYM